MVLWVGNLECPQLGGSCVWDQLAGHRCPLGKVSLNKDAHLWLTDTRGLWTPQVWGPWGPRLGTGPSSFFSVGKTNHKTFQDPNGGNTNSQNHRIVKLGNFCQSTTSYNSVILYLFIYSGAEIFKFRDSFLNFFFQSITQLMTLGQ